MLGYDPFRYRLLALTASGALSGLAGAAYAHLFGYAGATFASIQYSILPLLWVLLGGAGTTLGPLVGTAIMFYLVDLGSSATAEPPARRRHRAARPRPLRPARHHRQPRRPPAPVTLRAIARSPHDACRLLP